MKMEMNNQQNQVPVKRTRLSVETDSRDGLFAGLFLIFSIASIWLCFYGDFRSGFTIANWAFLILVTCYCNKSGGGNEKKGFPIFCGVCSFAMSVLFSLHYDYTVSYILVLAVVALDCAYFDGMWGRSRYGFTDVRTIYDVFNRLFKQTLSKLLYPFSSIYFKRSNGKSHKGGKIVLGSLIAIPVVIILISLLKTSDAAFEGLMSGIFEDTSELLWVLILGLILFPLILSFVFSIRKNLDSNTAYIIKDTHVLDKTVINTVLCAVSAVYVIYLVSQLSYFFGAFSGLLPENFSYAEYARRGFFELCSISAINLVIIFVSGALTKRGENMKRTGLNKTLSLFISVVTLIMISTVEAKIFMYVKEYGMTRMRLLPACFMVMLAVCFVAAIIRIFAENFPYIKLLICAAVIILSAVSIADVDTVVAKYNVAAYERGEINFNYYDLYELDESATPEIVKLLDSKNDELRTSAEQILTERAKKYYAFYNSSYERLPLPISINSFTFDTYREYTAIKGCVERLSDYYNKNMGYICTRNDEDLTDYMLESLNDGSAFSFSSIAVYNAASWDTAHIETSDLKESFDVEYNDLAPIDGNMYLRILFFKGVEQVGSVCLNKWSVKLENCQDGFTPYTVFDVACDEYANMVLTAR